MFQRIEDYLYCIQEDYSKNLDTLLTNNINANRTDFKVGLLHMDNQDTAGFVKFYSMNLGNYIIEADAEEITSKQATKMIDIELSDIAMDMCSADKEGHPLWSDNYYENLTVLDYENKAMMSIIKSPLKGTMFSLGNGVFAVGITPFVLSMIGIEDANLVHNIMMLCHNIYHCVGYMVVVTMKLHM